MTLGAKLVIGFFVAIGCGLFYLFAAVESPQPEMTNERLYCPEGQVVVWLPGVNPNLAVNRKIIPVCLVPAVRKEIF